MSSHLSGMTYTTTINLKLFKQLRVSGVAAILTLTLRQIHFIIKSVNLGRLPPEQVSFNRRIIALKLKSLRCWNDCPKKNLKKMFTTHQFRLVKFDRSSTRNVTPLMTLVYCPSSPLDDNLLSANNPSRTASIFFKLSTLIFFPSTCDEKNEYELLNIGWYMTNESWSGNWDKTLNCAKILSTYMSS